MIYVKRCTNEPRNLPTAACARYRRTIGNTVRTHTYFSAIFTGRNIDKKTSITRPARGDPTRPVKLENLIARPDPTRQISSTPTVDETGLKRRDFRNLRTGPAGTSTIHGQPCFFGSPIWVPKVFLQDACYHKAEA